MNLNALDREILFAINQANSSILDSFFFLISEKWFWIPLYIFLAWSIFKSFGKNNFIKILLSISLAFMVCDFGSTAIKKIVKRPRPSHTFGIEEKLHFVKNSKGEEYKGGEFGFPSAHAANTMMFCVIMILLLKGRSKYLLFVWTLAVSYSRIYLGVHFPSDVLVGWILGGLTAYVIYFVYLKKQIVLRP